MMGGVVPVPQKPHDLKGLDEPRDPYALRRLKGVVGLGLMSKAGDHGHAASGNDVQGRELLRQQDRVVEGQQKQRQKLHVPRVCRHVGHSRQHLKVVVGRDVVVAQRQRIEAQVGHELHLLDKVLHERPAVAAARIAGR